MRIGLVVDATCDLPPEFLAAHGIRVMPIGIRLGEQRLIDRRDPDTTLSFYRDHLPKVGSKDGSQPLSAAELQQWFLDELVTDFDYVVCLTVDSLRSPIFEHATQASFGLLQHYHERRHAAGIAGPFTLRVLDSHSVFAGIACLAAEGTRLLAQGSHPNALRTRLEQLSQQTCTYLVADDLGHLRRRGFQKGDRSGFVDRVKGAALGLGSLLDVKPVFSLADGEENRWRSRRASRSRRRSCSAMPWRGYRRVSCWHRNWVSAMPAIRPRCATCRASPRWRTPAASATSTCTWACSALPAASTWAPGP